jgi:hypothetical protein
MSENHVCPHFLGGICEKSQSGCETAYPLGCDWCPHPETRIRYATPRTPAQVICRWCAKLLYDYTNGVYTCQYCGGQGWFGERPCPDCGGAGVY